MPEPEYKLHNLQEDIESLANQLKNGCGNHGCCIREPTGMAPNGACRCTPRQISNELSLLMSAIDRMNNKGCRWDK